MLSTTRVPLQTPVSWVLLYFLDLVTSAYALCTPAVGCTHKGAPMDYETVGRCKQGR